MFLRKIADSIILCAKTCLSIIQHSKLASDILFFMHFFLLGLETSK